MNPFEWYGALPTWLKAGSAVVLLLISTGLWFAGYFWPWGWVAGAVLLAFAGPSRAGKKGYHDF